MGLHGLSRRGEGRGALLVYLKMHVCVRQPSRPAPGSSPSHRDDVFLIGQAVGGEGPPVELEYGPPQLRHATLRLARNSPLAAGLHAHLRACCLAPHRFPATASEEARQNKLNQIAQNPKVMSVTPDAATTLFQQALGSQVTPTGISFMYGSSVPTTVSDRCPLILSLPAF